MIRVACIVVAALALVPQQTTFRSGVDAVTVDVSVRDRTRVVTGLRASDFEVLDNGVLQEVSDVSYGKVPIDVTLALDVSFSVTGLMLQRLREAVRQLMRDLGPEDRLRLIGFNMRITEPIAYTSDAAAVDAALQTVAAGGGTSIRDAVAFALVTADEPGRRQLVVVFTDGIDSTSITTPDALVALSQRTNASVATVLSSGLGAAPPAARAGEEQARNLAKETGGTVIPLPLMTRTPSIARGTAIARGTTFVTSRMTPPDLTGTFRKVLDEFRSSYVLHFTPRGVEAGGFHTLDVKVTGRPSLTIRARRGYAVR